MENIENFTLRWYVPQKHAKIATFCQKNFQSYFKSLIPFIYFRRGFCPNLWTKKEIFEPKEGDVDSLPWQQACLRVTFWVGKGQKIAISPQNPATVSLWETGTYSELLASFWCYLNNMAPFLSSNLCHNRATKCLQLNLLLNDERNGNFTGIDSQNRTRETL